MERVNGSLKLYWSIISPIDLGTVISVLHVSWKAYSVIVTILPTQIVFVKSLTNILAGIHKVANLDILVYDGFVDFDPI